MNLDKFEENCVICQQKGCQCFLSSNGLCTKCYTQVPPQFKHKFWIWSHFLPIFAFIGCLISLSWGAYELQPWPQLNASEIFSLESGWKSYLGLFFGIILFLTTFLFPKIARKKYSRWMSDEKNIIKLELQIQEYYQKIKPNGNNYQNPEKKTSYYIFYYIFLILGLIANIMLFWQFLTNKLFLFSDSDNYLDLTFSFAIIVDVVIPITIFKKEPYFPNGARFVQNLRNGLTNINLIGIFIVFGLQIYIVPSVAGFFYAEPSWVSFLLEFHQISAIVVFGAYVWLFLDLIFIDPILAKKNQIKIEQSAHEKIPENSYDLSSSFIAKFLLFGKKGIRFILWVLLGILFLVIVVGGVLFIIGDYFMLISFFSVSIAIGIVVPVILWIWQLLKHPLITQKNVSRRTIQWISTIGVIFGLVLLLPISTVPIFANPSIEQQFDNQFGVNWDSTVKSKSLQFGNLRTTKYSFYDNMFLFNFTANTQTNVPYMIDYPPRIQGNTSNVIHTFYFDAYLPPELQFGTVDNNTTYSSLRLPVIILMHGEVEEKGAWNANMTSQYFARQGYLVCDLNYGYLHTTTVGTNNTGYYLPDLVRQIGIFTKFLASNAEYYHADLNNTYFAGRHLGGGIALLCGMGYNITFSSQFASNMIVRGIIPMYPVSDIGTDQTFLSDTMAYYGQGYIEGSADDQSEDYNPDWINYNPLRLLEKTPSKIAPIFFISGTHDWVIPMRYSAAFLEMCQQKNTDIITGLYLFGNDGFDGAFNSPYGQSIIYYLERFLLLTYSGEIV